MLWKRIICKFRQNKLRAAVFAALYTVIFLALFLMTGIYMSAEKQEETIQRFVGSRVTIRKYITYDGDRAEDTLDNSEIETIIQSKYVNSYNLEVISPKRFVGFKPFSEKESLFADGKTVGVNNSQAMTMFAAQGAVLKKGRHITEADSENPVVMISEALAGKNHLDIGDEITVKSDDLFKEFYGFEKEGTYKICGIYELPPAEDFVVAAEDVRENFLIIHEKILRKDFELESTLKVMVYLEQPEDIEPFIAEMKETLIDGGEFEKEFEYSWDKEWKDTVARPMLEMKRLSGMMLLCLAVGLGMIILILGAISMRKRRQEISILYGIGERKRCLIVQVLLEELAPVIVGVLLACGIGNACLQPLGNKMSQIYMEETNQINDQRLELQIMEKETPYLFIDPSLVNESIGTRAQEKVEFAMPVFEMAVFTGGVLIIYMILSVGQAGYYLQDKRIRRGFDE